MTWLTATRDEEKYYEQMARDYDEYMTQRTIASVRARGGRVEDAYMLLAFENELERQYYEYEESRGELAFCPETMPCYDLECVELATEIDPNQVRTDGIGFRYVERPVVALGPVVDRADPTQTYKLGCGHTQIAM